jgi:tRNA pseudouridine13 synthase
MFNQNQELDLPFLTADAGGMGGFIKRFFTDFFVEEIPLYKASGSGDHTYFFIEKRGISTDEAISRLSRSLNCLRKDFGCAGLKDARAITRQWLSVEHIEPERIAALDISNVKILEVSRHTNKIKPGHLAGNRFVIKLRQPDIPLKKAADLAEKVLAILDRRGVPNYFGLQRFGIRKNSHLLGLAVIKNNPDEFIDCLLGKICLEEKPEIAAACDFYEQGQYDKAFEAWPKVNREQRRALNILVKTSGDRRKAFDVFDKHMKSFYISSFQSYLFNIILARRMPDIDRLLDGDLAYKHDNGACFAVENAAVEQPRCDSFQISPTGPLYGHRTTRLTGAAGDIENSVLNESGLDEKDLKRMKRLGLRGGRRPLRFRPKNWKVSTGQDETSEYLLLEFELDAGCYATMVIREIAKKDFA